MQISATSFGDIGPVPVLEMAHTGDRSIAGQPNLPDLFTDSWRLSAWYMPRIGAGHGSRYLTAGPLARQIRGFGIIRDRQSSSSACKSHASGETVRTHRVRVNPRDAKEVLVSLDLFAFAHAQRHTLSAPLIIGHCHSHVWMQEGLSRVSAMQPKALLRRGAQAALAIGVFVSTAAVRAAWSRARPGQVHYIDRVPNRWKGGRAKCGG